jgi:hypothetical protein
LTALVSAALTALLHAQLIAWAPQQTGRAAGRGRAAAAKPATTVKCASEVGQGVATSRLFCDVIVSDKAADSVVVTLPPHRGPARLMFDLHNRVAVPPATGLPAPTFARNTAVVAVIGPKGELGRGAAVSEFRTAADLYDRVAGSAAGSVKAVAPGPPAPIEITIPAGVTSAGIVGRQLDTLTRLGKQTYETPGRPIAIVSNVRVEYTPLR